MKCLTESKIFPLIEISTSLISPKMPNAIRLNEKHNTDADCQGLIEKHKHVVIFRNFC